VLGLHSSGQDRDGLQEKVYEYEDTMGAGDVTQWYSACLACARPWLPNPEAKYLHTCIFQFLQGVGYRSPWKAREVAWQGKCTDER
jgi:hypothetical protein